MIGQRIESSPGLQCGPLLLLALSVGLIAAGLFLGLDWLALSAVLPVAWACSFGLTGYQRPFSASFTPEAIVAADPPATIPYASIQNVWADGYPHAPSEFINRSCTIDVQHEAGLLCIPARLNVPSNEVYRFLARRISPDGGRDVNRVLAEYLERQEAYFGPESISTYRAARRGTRPNRHRWLQAFSFGLSLAGVCWMVVGFTELGEIGWGWGGMVSTIFGVLFYAASIAEGKQSGRLARAWKEAAIVIGPQGMAMVQGDVQGEVRWPELLDIRFKPRGSMFHLTYASGTTGILLKMKGADILIVDIYNRPLYVIYDRIMAASGRSEPLRDLL